MATHADFAKHVYPAITTRLATHGFLHQGRPTWAHRYASPLRPVLQLKEWQGGAMVLRYGLSLDFVPHSSGENLAWHRTAKSARPDLWVDMTGPDTELGRLLGVDEINRRLPAVLDRMMDEAAQMWNGATVSTLPALMDMCEARAKESSVTSFPENTPTRAFVAARLGDPKAAETYLTEWANNTDASPDLTDKMRAAMVAQISAG